MKYLKPLLLWFQATSDSTKKTYNLNFRPTYSVLNVKLDASNLTDITVSRQKWIGWPEGISDDLTLAQIDIPRHHEMQLSLLPRSSGRDVSKYILIRTKINEIKIKLRSREFINLLLLLNRTFFLF